MERTSYVRICLITLILLMSLCVVHAGNDNPFVRFPALNPDGTQMAFNFQGDIWVVPIDGGEAKRLTVHPGYDFGPQWSGDGQHIAFTGNRFGNDDIFVIPSGGGVPKRLTHHSAADELSQWGPGDRLLFDSDYRTYTQVEWSPELYSVPVAGGTPSRLLGSLGRKAVMSPDKRFIAFERGDCRVAREGYRGPANRDIWLYDREKKSYTQLTDFKGNDYLPRWGGARTLYYISPKSGRYNVHSLELDDNGTVTGSKQLTEFNDFGVRYFDVSANGAALVMERETSIYAMKIAEKKPQKVNIEIGADYRFDPVERKRFAKDAEEYDVSPNGKLTAFVVRGEVFVTLNHKEKSRTVNVSRHPYRDQHPTWLNDNVLIFVSDRDGQQELYLVKSADAKQPDIFKSLKHKIQRITNTPELETRPLVSPDGKKIAFRRDRGQLVVADISADGKLSNEKQLLNGWDTPGGVAWSPDSKWLAYSLEDLNFNSEIFIHAADNSREPVNVSMHPRDDYSPVWSPDGSKLGFCSHRNNSDVDVWFAWLKKEDWEKTKQDWDEDEEDEPAKKASDPKTDEKGKDKKKKKDKKDKKKTVKPIVIDFKDIHERLTQVTAMSGNEGHLAISKDGKTFYFSSTAPGAKGHDLYSCKWDGTKIKDVTKGGQKPGAVSLDKEGKYLYLLKSEGQLARIDTKSVKMESLPFAAKMKINHPLERAQIFDDAVRALTQGFYDPEFHGRDWKKLVAAYRPMALSASTADDFKYMVNLLLGQLDASHMGLRGGKPAKVQVEKTGRLGVEVEPLDRGVRVNHVVLDSPADRKAGKLEKGDIILSVNGDKIDRTVNFYSLLTDKAKEKVLLEVENASGKVREVVIRPAATLGQKLYNEWVKERRRLTDKYSNGRLGYLHIAGMGWDSFERFERELTSAGYGKDGIVIDVRYNGGGWTTDYLMAILNVKQHAYTVPRGAAKSLKEENKKFQQYYPYAKRLPFYPWTKPSIAICNADSYSNAEIFSHAFKNLGIGKLVGIPTFGAVISTGGHGLLDGSYVRMPYRAWFVKATGENMEHGPAVPDFIVHDPPDAKEKGTDPQLERAVLELLKDIDKK